MNDDNIINSVISDIESKVNETIAIELINSRNFSRRHTGKKIDMIVIHATMTNRISDIIDCFCDEQSGVSTHYLIGRDGRTIQLVSESCTAWHIGKSSFNGRHDVACSSIGISLVGDTDIDFTNEQYNACAEVCALIISKYGVKAANIVGCDDVSDTVPNPGPKFNWKKLHDRYTMKFAESETQVSLDEKEPDVYEDDMNRSRMYNPQTMPKPIFKRWKLLSLLGL